MSLSAIAPFIRELPLSEGPQRLGVDPRVNPSALINSPNWPNVVTNITKVALESGDCSLEELFPGLAEFADEELPFLKIDAHTRTILQRAAIRTWEELASWTPSELIGIHNMSEVSIGDIIRVCVEQLTVAEASHEDEGANRLTRQELPHSATREETDVLRHVTDLLQLLAAWAVRERDFTRIGELLDLALEATANTPAVDRDLPPWVPVWGAIGTRRAWETARDGCGLPGASAGP